MSVLRESSDDKNCKTLYNVCSTISFSAGKIDGVHGMMNTEKKNNESCL